MIDITHKEITERYARACGRIKLRRETIEEIKRGGIRKGDALEAAKVAAILAVKRTPELIPHCHPIEITDVKVGFELGEDHVVACVEVRSVSRTGAEMESLCGVSAALLTLWDMVKYLEKDESGNYPSTVITDIQVTHNTKMGSKP